MRRRPRWSCALLAAAVLAPVVGLHRTPAALAGPYDAPANYYSTATGTGATLKNQLYTITGNGFVGRNYGDSRYYLNVLWQDPAAPANTLLIYNRASVSGAWDGGTTWNREHIWPQSLLGVSVDNSYKGLASDAFELAPANPSINTSRSNNPYGSVTSSGSYNLASDGYFYPGDADRGDAARSLFYMATRYGEGRPAGTNLTLVSGNNNPPTYQMGDLASLLKWNYTDPVDTFERRKNQYVYDKALNPTYYQGNRNPYIDHPEYVWAVFGTSANNSQLSVATASADGSSAATVDLGRSIIGGATASGAVTLNKSGSTPTTFDVTASGVATSLEGTGRTFDYNAQSKAIDVALPAGSNTAAGVKTGTVTVNNTDLTSASTGQGSADGNDTVTVTATVLDHSDASFAVAGNAKATSIDFGYIPAGFAARSQTFTVSNQPAASGYTAGLDIDSVTRSGSTAFTTDAVPTSNIPAGTGRTYTVTAATATPGTLSATHTLAVSDENLPGATAGAPLQLTATARVITEATFPVSGTLDLLAGETYSTGPFSVSAGVTLTTQGSGQLVVTGPQSNGAGSMLRVANGTARLLTDAAGSGGSPNLTLVALGSGNVVAESTQHLAGLVVGSSASAALAAGADKVLVTGLVDLKRGARVDLADNNMVITDASATLPGDVFDALASGYDHGRWTGYGIVSSIAALDPQHLTTLGFADNSVLGLAALDDQPVGPAAILVKYTWVGDANLDGLVNTDDLARITIGGTTWTQGDFNYDATVNADDIVLFNLGAAYGGHALQVVPEPGTLSLAILTLSLMRRRRRCGQT